MKHRNFPGDGEKDDYSEQNKSWQNNTDRPRWNKIRLKLFNIILPTFELNQNKFLQNAGA